MPLLSSRNLIAITIISFVLLFLINVALSPYLIIWGIVGIIFVVVLIVIWILVYIALVIAFAIYYAIKHPMKVKKSGSYSYKRTRESGRREKR